MKPDHLAGKEVIQAEVIIVGAGLAGLSASIYLARAKRDILVVDAGKSLAIWEPDVQNYLGFPNGISGEELIERGRSQAEKYGARFTSDYIEHVTLSGNTFSLRGRSEAYECNRLLLATGLYHLPPEIPGVSDCLGHSMFFCKDCDGWRVSGKRIAIIGGNQDAVEYALGMLHYSSSVTIFTNASRPTWGKEHAAWIKEYEIPVVAERVCEVCHQEGQLSSVTFQNGSVVELDAVFTTRGDVFHNRIAQMLGAAIDSEGQIEVNHCMRTTVDRLYAAGCVTPANCQMIVSAGQGAIAGQAINRDIFEESLATHSLRRQRKEQLKTSSQGKL